MTPDRHLGPARVPRGLCPDLLITETTYATTIRDSKRARERDLLKKVHDTVLMGGKVCEPFLRPLFLCPFLRFLSQFLHSAELKNCASCWNLIGNG